MEAPPQANKERPEVFTVTQTHRYPGLPEARRPLSRRLGDQLASQIASLWRSTQVSQRRNGPCRSLLLPEWQASERLPLSVVPRIQETAREAKLPPCAPSHRVRRVGGWGVGGRGGGGKQPLPGPACSLGYCSQMGTVNPCQLQICAESTTSAFLGCVASQSSPSAPGFNNMSNPFSLTRS